MADTTALPVVSEDGRLEGVAVTTVVTTVADTVQASATLTLPSAGLLPGNSSFMPAGTVAPTANSDVVFHQMDLGQYIDQQVQSRLAQLSGAWQQRGMGQSWMPMQGPQFAMPMFPPSAAA